MKKISQNDVKIVQEELAEKRKEFENIEFSNLEEKLEWIRNFFNDYISKLEKRYMTEKEFAQEWIFLPDELRIQFYLYFPEHGLNMANYSQELVYELAKIKERRKTCDFVNRAYFNHND